MKSLRIIQVLAKIARVLCLVAFIVFIVGAVGCLVGGIVYPLVKDIVLPEGKSISQILLEQGINSETVITSCYVGLFSCGVSIFLAKFNELFFINELKVGTPFDKEVVKDMRRVALVNIIVSVSYVVVTAITIAVLKVFFTNLATFRYEYGGGLIGYGITVLIISLLCDYGAELENKIKDNSKENKE